MAQIRFVAYHPRKESAEEQTTRSRMILALQFAGFNRNEAVRIFHAVIAPFGTKIRMEMLNSLRTGKYGNG